MDVLKQNLVETEEYAKYAVGNILQQYAVVNILRHFIDMLERKSKKIIKRMIV